MALKEAGISQYYIKSKHTFHNLRLYVLYVQISTGSDDQLWYSLQSVIGMSLNYNSSK